MAFLSAEMNIVLKRGAGSFKRNYKGKTLPNLVAKAIPGVQWKEALGCMETELNYGKSFDVWVTGKYSHLSINSVISSNER